MADSESEKELGVGGISLCVRLHGLALAQTFAFIKNIFSWKFSFSMFILRAVFTFATFRTRLAPRLDLSWDPFIIRTLKHLSFKNRIFKKSSLFRIFVENQHSILRRVRAALWDYSRPLHSRKLTLSTFAWNMFLITRRHSKFLRRFSAYSPRSSSQFTNLVL